MDFAAIVFDFLVFGGRDNGVASVGLDVKIIFVRLLLQIRDIGIRKTLKR